MKQNDNLSNIYMYAISESLSNLRESIKASFSPLITSQLTQIRFDILSESLYQFSSVLTTMVLENIDFNVIRDAMQQFAQYLPNYDFSFLTEGITISNNYVTLTDDTVETLTDLLYDSDTVTNPEIASKMSIKDFLSLILIPLLCMIIPMLQNEYYHKLDTIEAQQNQMREAEYQEALLNLETQHSQELEKLNSNINELLQYLESIQDNNSPDVEVLSLPDDTQEVTSESLAVECETDGVSDNHDANQLSN